MNNGAKRSTLVIGIIIGLIVVVAIGYFIIRQPTPTSTSEPLNVGIATWPGFAPGYVAKEKGFFGDLVVDFFIIDDFTARQNAFTSGNTQATISTLDSYAFESAQGVEGKVVMILDESFGADGIVGKPEIQSAEDLRGKKVAFTRGSPAHYFLIQYLRKGGMTLNDVETVEVDDPGRAGEAFVSGSVDAAVTWEPNISQIVASGQGHVLESTRTAPGLIVDVMVVSPSALEEREEDIQTLVDGWMEAVEYIKSNADSAYQIMATNLNIPIGEFPAMAEGLRYADLSRNRELLLPSDSSRAKEIFRDASAIWLEEGIVTVETNADDLITSEFVEN